MCKPCQLAEDFINLHVGYNTPLQKMMDGNDVGFLWEDIEIPCASFHW